jgi:hypothetical protein
MWTVIILVFWCIWRHRNDVVFNGVAASQFTIRDILVWSLIGGGLPSSSVALFLLFLILVFSRGS